jgi:hypothetical protein
MILEKSVEHSKPRSLFDRAQGERGLECSPKEALNKMIPFMVRQAQDERNQYVTVRPEPVEGLNQRFPNGGA